MSHNPSVILYDSSGNAVGVVLDGGVYLLQTQAQLKSAAKGTSTAAGLTSNPIDANTEALHVDGSNVTQPVSAATLPLPTGAATETTLASIKDTDGIKKITDALPTGANEIGSIAQGTKAAAAGAWPVVLYDASGNPAGLILDGGIYRIQAEAKVRSGSKGTSVGADITSNPIDVNTEALHVDGSNVTQPISAASLPLPTGAATETTLASIKDTDGIKKITDQLPAGTNEVGAVAQGTAAAATAPWPVRASDGATYINQALEHVTAASPHSARLSDGTSFYDATKTGQLPSALVGGRLDVNAGAWLGSTAPTVGQKTGANSVPVIIASDQSTLAVSFGAGNPTTVVSDFLKNSGSSSMVVNGSVTPVNFDYNADATSDILITAIRFVMTSGGLNFDGSNFGKGGGSLSTGIAVTGTVNNGTSITIATLNRNEDFLRLPGRALTEVGGVNDVIEATVDFSGRVLLLGGTADKIRVIVSDDLTGGARDIKYLTCTFYGVVE